MSNENDILPTNDNVVSFDELKGDPEAFEQQDTDFMLELAKGNLQHVLILGMTKDGGEYVNSNFKNGSQILWLLEKTRHQLMVENYDQSLD